MIPIGLHAYFAFKIKRFLPKNDHYFLFFLFGTIIAEIDKVISIFLSFIFYKSIDIYLFNNMITHSVVILSIMYLFILIIFEITKSSDFLNISKFTILGALFHISIDFIINLRPIYIFWPLPINPINLINTNLNNNVELVILGFEFLFFRLIASLLIEILLSNKNENSYYIKTLSLWMKSEVYIFIIFIASIFFTPGNTIELFSIFYLLSYAMLLFSIFKLKNSIK